MIDIEKLQKVNSLSLELKRHNLAGDMMQATAQAESMIDSNRDMSYIQKETVLDQAKRYGEDYATVNAQVRNLQNTVRQQQTIIEELQKRMEQLNFQFNLVKNQQVQQPQRQVQQHTQQNSFAQEAQIQQPTGCQMPGTPRPQATQQREAHAKVGNYNPGDVSVDKIFYSGSRK